MSLEFREEILEFSFVKIDANAEAQLLYGFFGTISVLSLTRFQRHISAHRYMLGYAAKAHALLENMLGRRCSHQNLLDAVHRASYPLV